MRFATSVVDPITRLPKDRFVIPAEVLVSVVMVALVKVAFASDRLLTVRLVTARLVIDAEAEANVDTVPLVAVKFVSVAEPLVRTVMFPLL